VNQREIIFFNKFTILLQKL